MVPRLQCFGGFVDWAARVSWVDSRTILERMVLDLSVGPRLAEADESIAASDPRESCGWEHCALELLDGAPISRYRRATLGLHEPMVSPILTGDPFIPQKALPRMGRGG
ncbi:hypothetical protein D3C87_1864730 [compost metagenome]